MSLLSTTRHGDRTARPRLLIPVEVQARELKARLFFAAGALRRGFPVAIGRSRDLHGHPQRFVPGVIVDNDATPISADFFRRARALGHRIVVWDEEAISTVGSDDRWYSRQRVDADSLGQVDWFFTRGPGDAAAIVERHPHLADRVVPAGNPRIDILHPSVFGALDATASDAPIVVMSRFSRSNPFSGSRGEILQSVRRRFRLGEAETTHVHNYFNHCHVLFDRFLPMVGRLAEHFPDRKVIVRPHPSERVETWHELARTRPNLAVTMEETAIDQAAGAALVVHNGCTTGLEAALIGRPVFAFTPATSLAYDVELPNSVSTCFATEEALFDAVAQTLRTPDEPETRAARIWSFVRTGKIGDDSGRLASDIILDVLERTYTEALPYTRGRTAALAKDWSLTVTRGIKGRIKSVLAPRRSRVDAAYYHQKFGGVPTRKIEEHLFDLGFPEIRVVKQSSFWWRLELDQTSSG